MTPIEIAALWSCAPIHVLRAITRQAGIAWSRQALQRLDDHLLCDIGLPWTEAEGARAGRLCRTG